MAEININEAGARKGKARAKKANLRVDLTPMVDLAFLLITFFMLTTTLLGQKAIGVKAPDNKGPQTAVSECQVLNLLADSLGQMYYWEGLECKAVNAVTVTGANTLKERIRQKKVYLKTNCLYESGKQKDVICLIKLLPGSRYNDMIKLLDEVTADSISTYAIQAYNDDEMKAVRREQEKMAVR